MSEQQFLTNQFLIAMPAMADPSFHETVTLICEHVEEGALGIVINRPTEMNLGDIFEQMDLDEAAPSSREQPVLRGGPVHQERGFVVHPPSGDWESTLLVSEEVQLTTSQDILSAMSQGEGPRQALIALGYAGWDAGQLEEEMAANAWLNVPASAKILFDTPFENRWRESAQLLGIDVRQLSHFAGHA